MSLFSRDNKNNKEKERTSRVSKRDVEVEKKGFSRSELRKILRDPSSRNVPGGGVIPRNERIKMEKEIFGQRYGNYISDKDFKKAIWGLRKEKAHAKTQVDRIKIDRKIRFLKKIGRF